ncbi:hypothetical protein [Microcoleus sp. K4-C2]|uniref:hypothetical protein n=1 Tax=Microcoleus sp. K4-C2 TaxID=2818792 RepID=UPI002FD4A068
MSQGFEIKSVSAKKSFPSHPQLPEVAEIQAIQHRAISFWTKREIACRLGMSLVM